MENILPRFDDHLNYLCHYRMKIKIVAGITLTVCLVLFTGCNRSSADRNADLLSKPQADRNGKSEQYANEAEQYESADRVIWQKPDLVIEQLGDVKGKVVADLGAGTGYFSRRIAYKGARVIAIDIDPRAILWMEEQKARFPIELRDRLVIRLAEPDDSKLTSQEVDIVLLVNTYSYLIRRVEYFERLQETIRPGGFVVIIDFKKKETPFGPPVEDRLDVPTVERELRSAGYTILKVDEESLDYQYIIKAKKE